MAEHDQEIAGPLHVEDDGRTMQLTHEHVGALYGQSIDAIGAPPPGALDPHAPQPVITGDPPRQTTNEVNPMSPGRSYLAPRSLLTESQRERYPAIIGVAVAGPCCMVAGESLTPDQVSKIGDFWQDFQKGFAQVDRAVDQGWQVIRPFVPGPYGDIIDTAHRARMTAMYGDQGAGAGRARADDAIRSAQELTRRARKGDPSAQAQMRAAKEAAGRGDPAARRAWRVIVLVARDDDRRIAEGTGSTPAAPSSSRAPAGGGFDPSAFARSFGGARARA